MGRHGRQMRHEKDEGVSLPFNISELRKVKICNFIFTDFVTANESFIARYSNFDKLVRKFAC